MGLALPPVSAVTREDSNLSLLPKQAEGLGPCCPKTVCPSNAPSGSFQKLHISILHEKSEKMIYNTAQYSNFYLKSSPSWVWTPRRQTLSYLQTFSDFDCSIIRINVKIIAIWKSCGIKAVAKSLGMGVVTIIGHDLNNFCTL